MKAGFLITALVLVIALFVNICQVHNSPIIIQPLSNKNYFIYLVYIRLHAIAIKIMAAILVAVHIILYKTHEYMLALKSAI